jgi:hypothetical protein
MLLLYDIISIAGIIFFIQDIAQWYFNINGIITFKVALLCVGISLAYVNIRICNIPIEVSIVFILFYIASFFNDVKRNCHTIELSSCFIALSVSLYDTSDTCELIYNIYIVITIGMVAISMCYYYI